MPWEMQLNNGEFEVVNTDTGFKYILPYNFETGNKFSTIDEAIPLFELAFPGVLEELGLSPSTTSSSTNTSQTSSTSSSGTV